MTKLTGDLFTQQPDREVVARDLLQRFLHERGIKAVVESNQFDGGLHVTLVTPDGTRHSVTSQWGDEVPPSAKLLTLLQERFPEPVPDGIQFNGVLPITAQARAKFEGIQADNIALMSSLLDDGKGKTRQTNVIVAVQVIGRSVVMEPLYVEVDEELMKHLTPPFTPDEVKEP